MADEIKFTAENLANQCLGIRVDFLDEDELDQELFMRNMFLTGEQTMSRRRRALREALKQEKEEGVSVKHLPNSVENELAICEAKLHRLEASFIIYSTSDCTKVQIDVATLRSTVASVDTVLWRKLPGQCSRSLTKSYFSSQPFLWRRRLHFVLR